MLPDFNRHASSISLSLFTSSQSPLEVSFPSVQVEPLLASHGVLLLACWLLRASTQTLLSVGGCRLIHRQWLSSKTSPVVGNELLKEVLCWLCGVVNWRVAVQSNLAQHLPATDEMMYSLVDNKLLVLFQDFCLSVVLVVVMVRACPWWVFTCSGKHNAVDADVVVDTVLVNHDNIVTCSDNRKRPGCSGHQLVVVCLEKLSDFRR